MTTAHAAGTGQPQSYFSLGAGREILRIVLSFSVAGVQDLHPIMLVCKDWNRAVADDESVWKDACERCPRARDSLDASGALVSLSYKERAMAGAMKERASIVCIDTVLSLAPKARAAHIGDEDWEARFGHTFQSIGKVSGRVAGGVRGTGALLIPGGGGDKPLKPCLERLAVDMEAVVESLSVHPGLFVAGYVSPFCGCSGARCISLMVARHLLQDAVTTLLDNSTATLVKLREELHSRVLEALPSMQGSPDMLRRCAKRSAALPGSCRESWRPKKRRRSLGMLRASRVEDVDRVLDSMEMELLLPDIFA